MSVKTITAAITNGGVPAAGLSPSIKIIELTTSTVFDGAMTEIGFGWYKFDFQNYDLTKQYVITIDAGSSVSAGERYQFAGNESWASEVWEQPAQSAQADTMGELMHAMHESIETVRDFQEGRWRINGSQMVFYKEDNVTEIARFNLFDGNGTPFTTDPRAISERRRA